MIDPVRITLLLSSVARREPQQKLSSVKHMLRCICAPEYLQNFSWNVPIWHYQLMHHILPWHQAMIISQVLTPALIQIYHISNGIVNFFFIPVAFCFPLIYCVSNIQESAIVSWVPFHIDTQIWSKTRCSEETGSLYHCFHPNTQN